MAEAAHEVEGHNDMDERMPAHQTHPAFKAATVFILAGGIAVAYASERAFRRWMKRNHPLAELHEAMDQWSVSYREKRAGAGELLGLAWDLFGVIADNMPDRPTS